MKKNYVMGFVPYGDNPESEQFKVMYYIYDISNVGHKIIEKGVVSKEENMKKVRELYKKYVPGEEIIIEPTKELLEVKVIAEIVKKLNN